MKNYLLLLLSFTLISIGCYKDSDLTPEPQVIIETTKVFVNTSISGSVVDLDGNFISDYDLRVNDKLNNIPADYFLLKLEDLKKKGQTVHVFKDDNQIGIKTHLLVENDINHIEILQHAPYKEKVMSDNYSKVEFSKTLSADLSSAKWEGGYEGEIMIDYINIEAENSLTPIGYTSLSDIVAVDSKGGFYLSIKTDVDKEVTAQKDFPIILNTSNLADDINSLFVFDKENEIWVLVAEISSGDEVEILGDGYYTFANYTSGVFVEGIVSKEGKPVAYQPMKWDLASLSNSIFATEKGNWIALLPEKESVKVNLLNPCDESLQTETLEIELQDLKDQNLIIEDSDNYQLLDFEIVDCKGNIVSEPSLSVNSGGDNLHYLFSDEYGDRWIAVCDEYEISAVNKSTGIAGPGLDWSTDLSGGLDVLTDCNEFSEGYSYIKIREDEEVYDAFEIEIQGNRTILKSEDGKVKFIFKGMQRGMYDESEVNIFIDDKDFGDRGYYIGCENSEYGCGINNFEVTHFGLDENEMVRVTFSGKVWMQTLSPAVVGDFDVEGVIVIKL